MEVGAADLQAKDQRNYSVVIEGEFQPKKVAR
jgi:hypothetical protein